MTTSNQLEFKGDLRRHPVAELLTEFVQNKLSGSLRLECDDKKSVIYFESGSVVFAVSNERCFRLYEILLSQQLIEKKDLSGIEGFTNDLHLAKSLVAGGNFSKPSIDSVFLFQISKIIQGTLPWKSGDFVFSASARIKSAIHFDIDLQKLLNDYVAQIHDRVAIARFELSTETYALRENSDTLNAELTPQEGFLLSRLGNEQQSLESLIALCGIEQDQLLPSLYKLWMSGYINRHGWQSALSDETTAKLSDTKFELKKEARSFEDDQAEAAQKESDRIAKEAADDEKQLKLSKEDEEISLEDYLARVEKAATHYEIFDISPDSKISAIKSAYFALAKRFHPDLFFKQVEPETLSRIQSAFTEIAQAYETLKDEESREVYDFKLRKVIKQLRANESGPGADLTKEDMEITGQDQMASENFDTGYNYLLNDEVERALPYLGRAVHIGKDNARYHAYYGQALSFESDSHRKAENEFQQALKLDPDNVTFRYMLAELFVKIGHKKRAIGELKRLLGKDTGHRDARELLDSLQT